MRSIVFCIAPVALIAALLGAPFEAWAQGDADASVDALPLDARARPITPRALLREVEKGHVVLFDVRDPEEFAVSHIAGAQRIDAVIGREQTIARTIDARHVDARHKAVVVFYCTTMGRSQMVADSVLQQTATGRNRDPRVLAGGLIAWANARFPLVAGAAGHESPTHLVHPHDPETARMLADQSRVSFGGGFGNPPGEAASR